MTNFINLRGKHLLANLTCRIRFTTVCDQKFILKHCLSSVVQKNNYIKTFLRINFEGHNIRQKKMCSICALDYKKKFHPPILVHKSSLVVTIIQCIDTFSTCNYGEDLHGESGYYQDQELT